MENPIGFFVKGTSFMLTADPPTECHECHACIIFEGVRVKEVGGGGGIMPLVWHSSRLSCFI